MTAQERFALMDRLTESQKGHLLVRLAVFAGSEWDEQAAELFPELADQRTEEQEQA